MDSGLVSSWEPRWVTRAWRIVLTNGPYRSLLVCLEALHEGHAMLGGRRLSGLVVEELDIVEVGRRALLVNVLRPGLLALCWLHVD